MSNKAAQEARGRRSQARERRRGHVEEPVEKLDRSAEPAGPESSEGTNGNLGGAAAKMVGTAVAAGLLGALGGAVKAALERRRDDNPPGDDRGAEAMHEVEDDEAVDGPGREEQPESDEEGEAQARVEPEEPQADAAEEDLRGLSEGDAEAVVATARRSLEGLLGTDVERVSGLARRDGRWSVQLEVVELARIPESTDVLATYEVVLDDGGDMVSASRVRRYRRAQVEEEA
jgi:hypothetical protein